MVCQDVDEEEAQVVTLVAIPDTHENINHNLYTTCFVCSRPRGDFGNAGAWKRHLVACCKKHLGDPKGTLTGGRTGNKRHRLSETPIPRPTPREGHSREEPLSVDYSAARIASLRTGGEAPVEVDVSTVNAWYEAWEEKFKAASRKLESVRNELHEEAARKIQDACGKVCVTDSNFIELVQRIQDDAKTEFEREKFKMYAIGREYKEQLETIKQKALQTTSAMDEAVYVSFESAEQVD